MGKRVDSDIEADAYENPTRLFQLINDMAAPEIIIQHAFEFPEEVKTWIVSRRNLGKKDDEKGDGVTWRYLPLHLICLQQNPDKDVLVAMRNIFPEGLTHRDHHGNLPIHYLVSEGFSKEKLVLIDIVADYEYKCLSKKDGEGRNFLEIIRRSVEDDECRLRLEQWLEERRQESGMSSPMRPKSLDKDQRKRKIERGRKACDDDLVQARRELKHLKQIIDDLEWKCETKDNTIDSLTAQLMNLEKKMKSQIMQGGAQETQRDKAKVMSCQSNTAGGDETYLNKIKVMKEEIASMKAQMMVDASIVSDQQGEIKKLELQLKDAEKAKAESDRKHNKLQLKIQTFRAQITQHDEAVVHIRKVTGILQGEVNAKEKENAILKKDLEVVKASNDDLKRKIVALEQDADEKFEGFQEDIKRQNETLATLLGSFKDFRLTPPTETVHGTMHGTMQQQYGIGNHLFSEEKQSGLDPVATVKGTQMGTHARNVVHAMSRGCADADNSMTSIPIISALGEKSPNLPRDFDDTDSQQIKNNADLTLNEIRRWRGNKEMPGASSSPHSDQNHKMPQNCVTSSNSALSERGLKPPQELYQSDQQRMRANSNDEERSQKVGTQDKISTSISPYLDHQNREIPQNCVTGDDESEQSSISIYEIREKQSRLQEELRDIYSQIRSVVSDNDAMILKDDSFDRQMLKDHQAFQDELKGNAFSTLSIDRKLREERRPWRGGDNAEGIIYNV